ncbi:MAG: OmpH family outer membrane protein [Bacteroidota bacterium]|nr:OmpH family outer membrane protein [Bacteroidota bacterium]
MKHFLFVVCFCFSMFTLDAQTKASSDFKIAYFDMDSLLTIMPEFKVVSDSAQVFYLRLEAQLNDMNVYIQKLKEEIISKDWTKEVAAVKAAELEALQTRAKKFQEIAREEYAAYRERLLAPVIAKINAAAKKVAKEKGYAFVLDGGKEVGIIIFANESYNIFDDMCKELGIPLPKK